MSNLKTFLSPRSIVGNVLKHFFMVLAFLPGLLSFNATILFAEAYIANARIGDACFNCINDCTGTSELPDIGDQCVRGPAGGADPTKLALYAGKYQGYHYMTTPSGCGAALDSDDTCNGGADVVIKWASGAPASNTKIIANPSQVYGGDDTVTIAAQVGAVAAKYCDTMKFGGYDDWYLPAMRIGATTNCTDYSGEIYNVLYKNSNQYRPNNNATCNADVVPGPLSFSVSTYLTSVEASTVLCRTQGFSSGMQGTTAKVVGSRVRCVRRYH